MTTRHRTQTVPATPISADHKQMRATRMEIDRTPLNPGIALDPFNLLRNGPIFQMLMHE